MKPNKNLLTIIAIAIFIISIGVIYGLNMSKISKQTLNLNTIYQPIIPELFSKEKKLVPKSSNLSVYDSLEIDEKIYKSLPIFEIYNNKIPILMYHSISYEKGNSLRVSKENFRLQMKYLKDNNYTPITVDELYNYMQTGKIAPKKPIVITFDDGYKDNYTNAYPILKEFKFKATIFVITNTIDKDINYLTSNEIKSMDSNNIRIESHTVAHEHLDEISYKDDLITMKASKEKLEKILNRKIYYIEYPYGGYNDNVIKAAKESSYKLAFSTKFGLIDKNDNIYSLGRIFVNSNFTFDEFKSKLNPKK